MCGHTRHLKGGAASRVGEPEIRWGGSDGSGEIHHERAGAAVDRLSQNSYPFGVRKLVGHNQLHRIRVGQYRIVYEVDNEEQVILITRIRHRRDVYR